MVSLHWLGLWAFIGPWQTFVKWLKAGGPFSVTKAFGDKFQAWRFQESQEDPILRSLLQNISLFSQSVSSSLPENEQDQRNIPDPTLCISNVMHNWMCLIVSIILKNHFSNTEIMKDPSDISGVILPSVPMETKLLMFSRGIINGICPYNVCWLSRVSSTWYLSSPLACSTDFNLRLLWGF